jgi:serine/threonine protein phosphatase 1
MIEHVEHVENKEGRDFVVGDIHGMYTELMQALHEVDFDRTVDRCFSVGDLVDRGYDSQACLDLVKQPWFHATMGNHELLMIDSLDSPRDARSWRFNGGGWCADVKLRSNIELASTLPLAITVHTREGKVGICHAEPPTGDWDVVVEDLEYKHSIKMVWGRSVLSNDVPITTKNVVRTFHGHTILDEPRTLGNAVFIDTGSFETKIITVLEIQGKPSENC